MKKIFIFASLLTCTQLTTFTMENFHHGYQKLDIAFDEIWNTEDIPLTSLPQQKNNEPYSAEATKGRQTQTSPEQPQKDVSEDKIHELVTFLHKKIKEKYRYFSIGSIGFVTIDNHLQEKDFFDIMHIIDQRSDTHDFIKTNLIKIFNLMYEKERYDDNQYFLKAQNYFMDLAHKNINSVTSKTLTTITDANVIQPTPQLNALPLYIKKCFMDYVYQYKINHSYDIVLTGHKGVITKIAIHTPTHRAATSSYADRTLRLWDLTTGKSLGILAEDLAFHCITFSADGSHLATATNYKDDSSTIRIWDTQSTGYLRGWTVKESDFDSLTYKNNTLIASHTNSPSKISIFILDNNKLPTIETINLPQEYTKENHCYFTWGNYQVKNPYFKEHRSSTLTVTKKQCQQFCIYQQAIKNDPLNFTIEKIDKSDFTEYEKDTLHKLLITEQRTRRST